MLDVNSFTSPTMEMFADLSSLPTPTTTIPDFSSAITIDTFVDRVIGAMDTRESVKVRIIQHSKLKEE